MFWPTVAPALAGFAIWQARRWEERFIHATHNCADEQNRLLQRILRNHQRTEFGEKHAFQEIRSWEQYRMRIPIHKYEDLEPYLTRVRQGQTQALLADPHMHMYALTSGTTASRKYIPVTRQYLKDYRRATSIWGRRIFDAHPKAFLKPILQLVSDWDECRTEMDIPCGSVSGLTTHMMKPVVRWLYCLPACTGKIKDATAKLYLALRMGLMSNELGILAAANPSTLLKLAQMMESRHEDLFRDLHDGTIHAELNIPEDVRRRLMPFIKKMPARVKQLETIRARHGVLTPEHAWSPIHTIGCWTGGSVGLYLRQFPQYYGTTPIRDLGLLASEGRMTIPLEENTPGGVLDITSHFFEFIPEGEIEAAKPVTLTAADLEVGKNYYILPTTSYGLYRYNIYDVVKVIGFKHSAPIVEFLSKGSLFSNMTGEKLSEFQVVAAMKAASQRWGHLPAAYTLAPYWDARMPGYSLFLEEHDLGGRSAEEMATDFDSYLKAQNIEYETKRDSQRLGMIEICLLPRGTWASWDIARISKTGGSSEQYKRPCLINDVNFRSTMPVVRSISGRSLELASRSA